MSFFAGMSIPFDAVFVELGPLAEETLRDFVLDVVDRFGPNHFSVT